MTDRPRPTWPASRPSHSPGSGARPGPGTAFFLLRVVVRTRDSRKHTNKNNSTLGRQTEPPIQSPGTISTTEDPASLCRRRSPQAPSPGPWRPRVHF